MSPQNKEIPDFFIETDYHQLYKNKQIVAGDVFLQHKLKEDDRIISVLSDGLGSGIKANVLATLTSTMAINFISNHKDIYDTAEIIMKTLPVCKVRKISYSTFTITDITSSGFTRIIEFDNPAFLLIRDNRFYQVNNSKIKLQFKRYKENELNYYEFNAQLGDRIIFFSDGISQSGIGSRTMPFGWGEENIKKYILQTIKNQPLISARDLAKDLVLKANANDSYKPKDDITAAVVYFRKPRKMMIFTGPPLSDTNDAEVARNLEIFDGKKVVCGGTTAKIIARELNREIKIDLKNMDDEVPPFCKIEGMDLVTEGTYTLGKVLEILEQDRANEYTKDNGVSRLLNIMLNSDIIYFVVGTRINQAHQDPYIPVELGIRRNLIKNIIKQLEEKYLKQTYLKFI